MAQPSRARTDGRLLLVSQQAADKEALKSDVRAFLKLDASKEFVISTAEWLGLFEEEPIPAKVRPHTA